MGMTLIGCALIAGDWYRPTWLWHILVWVWMLVWAESHGHSFDIRFLFFGNADWLGLWIQLSYLEFKLASVLKCCIWNVAPFGHPSKFTFADLRNKCCTKCCVVWPGLKANSYRKYKKGYRNLSSIKLPTRSPDVSVFSPFLYDTVFCFEVLLSSLDVSASFSSHTNRCISIYWNPCSFECLQGMMITF